PRRRHPLRRAVRRAGDRPPGRYAPRLPAAARARPPPAPHRDQLPRQHLRAQADRRGVDRGGERGREPARRDRPRARRRARSVHRPHPPAPEHLIRPRRGGARAVRGPRLSEPLPRARRGGARRGCCGARGRDLPVHGGPAVLDPRRVAPLPQLGRARDRHDQPPGGEARARGGDLSRDARARHRLRLLERGARRGGDRGRAQGAGGQRRPRAAHDHARGGGVARAHRLPVPDRARPRDRHRARRHPRHRAARAGAAPGEAPLSAITVVGSVAFDTIETPVGRAEEVLGGSATYFAVAASFCAPVSLVARDTMNPWIASARASLVAVRPRVDLLVVNDEEARLLAGEHIIARAARRILELGPRSVLVKRGEYGAILFSPESVFAVPAYPLEEVFDPTGAGDAFAGGVMGYLAATGEHSEGGLRRAIVFGSVLASFVVEDFGGQRLRTLTRDDIDRRYRQFVALTEF